MAATFPHWSGKCEGMRLVDGLNETANPFVAAVDIVYGTGMTLKCYSKIDSFSTFFADLTSDVRFFWSFDAFDVAVVVALTLFWTILRHYLVKSVFEPFACWIGVLDQNLAKFGESVWKAVAYGFLWSSAVYVTFFRGYDFFQRPIYLWADHRFDASPIDLCCLYALECSFYVHSVYATLYMDAWRKDSKVMLVHHFVTLTLIFASYAVGFLKIGVIIFVLDDFSDVVLESGKAATYLRNRKTGFSRFFDVASNIMGVIFAIQWAILRLQMHLTKVWRTGTIGVWVSLPALPTPFHLFFIAFLGSLFVFYAYWFVFIVMFIARILGGKQGSAEDPREDDEEVDDGSASSMQTAEDDGHSDEIAAKLTKNCKAKSLLRRKGD